MKTLAIDLDLVKNLLASAELPNSSAEAHDEHFDQIAHFIEQEAVEEAAELIEQSFLKKNPDIRVIFYYFYVHFCHYGITSFPIVFPFIISMINDHWDVLRPLNRKENHFQSSVHWFFSHLLSKIKYCEKLHRAGKSHPLWEKSVTQLSVEEIDDVSSAIHSFQEFFSEKWPKSSTKDRILHLRKKVEELKNIVVLEKLSKEEMLKKEEILPTPASLEETEAEFLLSKQEDTPENFFPSEDFSSFENSLQDLAEKEKDLYGLSLEGFSNDLFPESQLLSPPLEELTALIEENKEESLSSFLPLSQSLPQNTEALEGQELFLDKLKEFSRKMKLFEEFVHHNDYLKAAIVGRDIDHLLENFDPLSYFPKLFGKYFALFAKHVTALSEQYDKKETLQVQKLEKLYQADIDMFVDW